MLDHITPLEALEEEALQIDAFLNETCSEDGNEAAERICKLSVYMARTGKMLADARYWQDIALRKQAEAVIQSYPSQTPTIKKKLIEHACTYENHLVTWIERLNRCCTHDIEICITLISKAKEEMKLSGYAGNVRHSGNTNY
jgi:hypothetical protein